MKVIEPKKHDKHGFGVGGQHIQRDRLQADTIKWIMSKLLPKTYGDKLDLTTDGKALEQVQIVIPGNSKEKKDEKKK